MMMDKKATKLKDLVARRRQLVEMISAEKARKAGKQGAIKQDIQEHIEWLQKRLEQINQQQEKLLEEKAEWTKKLTQLKSVPGIGEVTATTLVGIRFNPLIKSFYERLLAKGKLKKVALTACMHKLLIILNAMVKNGQPWTPQLSLLSNS